MTRFAICATIKNENIYLREWVDYHFSLGVDKIFLYNNNNDNGENPNLIVQDYIDAGKIEITKINYYDTRPFQFKQTDAYNDCLEKNDLYFDWIVFIDLDEFITIDKYGTLQELFKHTNYNNFDCVVFNMVVYGNNTIYYEQKPVQERFPEQLKNEIKFWNIRMNQLVHPFVKTSKGIRFYDGNPHIPKLTNKTCCTSSGYNFPTNTLSNTITGSAVVVNNLLFSKHYYFKSFVEFLNRCRFTNPASFSFKLNQYKQSVEWTEDHERVYQQFLKDNNIKAPEN